MAYYPRVNTSILSVCTECRLSSVSKLFEGSKIGMRNGRFVKVGMTRGSVLHVNCVLDRPHTDISIQIVNAGVAPALLFRGVLCMTVC